MVNKTNLIKFKFYYSFSSNINYMQAVRHCSNAVRNEIETLSVPKVSSGWISLTFNHYLQFLEENESYSCVQENNLQNHRLVSPMLIIGKVME